VAERHDERQLTCVGICAHESALKGGAVVHLGEFTLR